MTVGSSRRVHPWLAAFLAAGAVCSASCASEKAHLVREKEHAVLLRSELQSNGHRKGVAHPHYLIICGYDPANPGSVTWVYRHKSTRIRFEPSTPAIPDPTCDDGLGECTLQLPKGLVFGTKYKYTVTGKHDGTTDLDPNDPYIQVDR